MAEQNCGASVEAVATRVAVLEQDGVPIPGAGNMYTTDALVKLDLTPVFTKGNDIEVMNAGGGLCVTYKERDRFKRYDLVLEICTLDPELEQMLVGGLPITAGGFTIGATTPRVGAIGAPFGVSMELWTKHIVNGDLDVFYPYIHWYLGRTYWQPDKTTFDVNHMSRMFQGYTSENPNFEDGPAGDWLWDSASTLGYAYTRTLPTIQCGSQATPVS
jgi:hypothetical protein